MIILIGLGNPGPEYKNNRHNIGFQVIDLLAENLILKSLKLNKKFQAEICEGTFGDEKIILAKPQTFMNNSGLAVKKISAFYKVKPEQVIIVHDELDLPIGKIRINQGSSSGGNNGVESIITETGNKNFIRIRIGIANELREKIPADKFVLQNFSSAEKKIIKELMPQVLKAIQMLLRGEPLQNIQNKFN